jgi:putative tryptophan/tyrosine transport system substrate-binding protein
MNRCIRQAPEAPSFRILKQIRPGRNRQDVNLGPVSTQPGPISDARCLNARFIRSSVLLSAETHFGVGTLPMAPKRTQLFLVLALVGFWSAGTQAQTLQLPQLGVLNPFTPPEPGFQTFMDSLQKLGFVEGKNFTLRIRWAEGHIERLPQLAAELATYRPDVIFAPSIQGLEAVKEATKETNTPIVAAACDPLDKLVRSLARPGGNTTGFSCVHSELAGKRFEMVKELLPDLSQLAVLYNPTDPNKHVEFTQIKDIGKRMNVNSKAYEITKEEEIELTFNSMESQQAAAVIVLVDPFMIFHRKRLAELALARKMVMVSGFKEFVEAGALMSYGADRSWLFAASAGYVSRILQGEKAGELPVQEPVTFELYINGAVAAKLGLQIPTLLQMRATKIID